MARERTYHAFGAAMRDVRDDSARQHKVIGIGTRQHSGNSTEMPVQHLESGERRGRTFVFHLQFLQDTSLSHLLTIQNIMHNERRNLDGSGGRRSRLGDPHRVFFFAGASSGWMNKRW
jgi:hypothetical protein